MKYVKIAAWTVAGLLCLQFITYFTLSNRFLTHVALRCRPECINSNKKGFKWVCLYNINQAVNPDLAQDIKNAFEERYDKVYYDTRDIPKECIIYDEFRGKKEIAAYKDGYLYTIAFTEPGFMNIQVSHSDHESNKSAYGSQGWYFWMFFWWVRVHTCHSFIS